MLYDKQSGESAFSIKNVCPTSVSEYNNKLYYLDRANIMVYDLESEEKSILKTVVADKLIIADNRAYYSIQNNKNLYSIGLDGRDNKVVANIKVRGIERIKDGLVVSADEGIYTIKDEGKQVNKISEEVVDDIAITENGDMYYLKNKEIWRVNSRAEKILGEYRDKDYKAPRGIKDGFRVDKIIHYDGFIICNNHLYARQVMRVRSADICWASRQEINISNNGSYSWVVFDMHTGDKGNINNIKKIVPVDNGYFKISDEGIIKITYIQ